MKKLSLIPLIFIMISCKNTNNNRETNISSPNESFALLKESFFEDLWILYPSWASSQGYHKNDSLLNIYDEAFRIKEAEFVKNWQHKLWEFKPEDLSPSDRTDWLMLDNQLKSTLFYANEYRGYEWDPSSYNVGSTFGEMINGTYAPLNQRMRYIFQRLALVPAYYDNAKKQIKNPTLEHTDLAINQNRGTAGLFGKSLLDSVAKTNFSKSEKIKFNEYVLAAANSVNAYADWLEKEVKPNLSKGNAKSFRLGKELFEKKFEFDIQSRYSAAEIYDIAVKHKMELHAEMYKLAIQLWTKYLANEAIPKDTLSAISKMINKLSERHSTAKDFQKDIENQIPNLAQFVKEKNLLYLDPSKPLEVRKEPDYMAGVAGASISAPGPYDKNGKTFYNVGSLAAYTPERAESYLREYNYYILQILNIHEAIPGHYAQLVYSNQSPSLVKSILGNGAMVEGWAVYTERMMIENGYGNNEPEMWLMYYKWNLRATCNTILDVGIHCNNLSEADALDLMTRQAFQQDAEAKGKWKRATLTQVQLCSYFTGYTEIYNFRNDLKQKLGDKFNLKSFHEEFLSYGSAPVKYVREIMEKEME